jgi:hypothetical protein
MMIMINHYYQFKLLNVKRFSRASDPKRAFVLSYDWNANGSRVIHITFGGVNLRPSTWRQRPANARADAQLPWQKPRFGERGADRGVAVGQQRPGVMQTA